MNIILGITGSVSAYKTPWLVRDLKRAGHDVRIVMSKAAGEFVAPLALEATSQHPVITDPFDPRIQEGGSWHVHIARWADVMLIAPCSATTLSRLTTAQCDTAVTLVAFSLPKDKPLLVAPAMDSDMWLHPATQRNVKQLQADGVTIIQPDTGELASGLTGSGRLPEIASLVNILDQHGIQNDFHSTKHDNVIKGSLPADLTGIHVLITAGPTHEPIDPVRSIINHSTGTMGFALAQAAAERGFLVTLVTGPVTLPTPRGVERINVRTAQEMFLAVQQHASADIFVMAAAVADFTPKQTSPSKIKKSSITNEGFTLELERTTDILATVGGSKSATQVVIGFALETNNVIDYAREKLHRKHADVIVANQAGIEHSGFGAGKNTITIVTQETEAPYPPMSKRACAEVVMDVAMNLHHKKQQEIA